MGARCKKSGVSIYLWLTSTDFVQSYHCIFILLFIGFFPTVFALLRICKMLQSGFTGLFAFFLMENKTDCFRANNKTIKRMESSKISL